LQRLGVIAENQGSCSHRFGEVGTENFMLLKVAKKTVVVLINVAETTPSSWLGLQ
jgi:hypothetical protein